jgi:hypothetical protein
VNLFLEDEENIENFVLLKDFSPLLGIKLIQLIKLKPNQVLGHHL